MSFLISVLKAQDAFEDGEQRAFRAKKRELQGMFFWGKKSAYGGNELALGREGMPSCLQGLALLLSLSNRSSPVMCTYTHKRKLILSRMSTIVGRPLQCPEFFENNSRSRTENAEEESGYRGGFL